MSLPEDQIHQKRREAYECLLEALGATDPVLRQANWFLFTTFTEDLFLADELDL